ncbi:hypothetical protein BH09PAT2_BH09PAT2_02420 [soil metagenome]
MQTKNPEFNIRKYDFLLLLLIIICIVGFIILWIQQGDKPRTEMRTEKSKSYEYTSNGMKFSIFIPKDMMSTEIGNSLTLANDKKMITIDRTATNFDNITDYYDLLKTRNHYDNTKINETKINGYDSIIAMIENKSDVTSRVYFIYTDHWVYTMETYNKDLYTDLDTMADSFKYTPDLQ